MPRVIADDVPDQAEVAEVAGGEEQAVGCRVATQPFEQLVGALVERVDARAEVALTRGRRVGEASTRERQSMLRQPTGSTSRSAS